VSKVRVCFLGTPEIAVTCLQGLLDDEHFEVVGVITQPDKPAGRKMQLTPTPVKVLALAKGLPVLSPQSVNVPEVQAEVQAWTAEIAIVVAFGQIVSQSFLDMFSAGCVNVHASLLPLWRGAAPIQRSIEAGDKVSGVCLQKMVKKLDAGDVIGFRTLQIDEEVTAIEMLQRMALAGVDLLKVDLMDYLRGNLAALPQDESKVTYAKKLDKMESALDWTQPALRVHNKIRAFTMGPGTWTHFKGQKLKIHRSKLVKETLSAGHPGELKSLSDGRLIVMTGDTWLEILQLQPESRNRLNAAEFLRGQALQKGDKFEQ
jgi:methionyl-tRNA formyltransferase